MAGTPKDQRPSGVDYTYDGDGNRLQKSSGEILVRRATEILDESDAGGDITDEYIFFGGKRIAMRNVVNGTSTTTPKTCWAARNDCRPGQTSVCYHADFYPYGGERDITVTCSPNYKFEGEVRRHRNQQQQSAPLLLLPLRPLALRRSVRDSRACALREPDQSSNSEPLRYGERQMLKPQRGLEQGA